MARFLSVSSTWKLIDLLPWIIFFIMFTVYNVVILIIHTVNQLHGAAVQTQQCVCLSWRRHPSSVALTDFPPLFSYLFLGGVSLCNMRV